MVYMPSCETRHGFLVFQMEIKGKVHCFFEQSGTFKNEFIKLGIPAFDYDIQDNFGETDHVIDLFGEIEAAYERERERRSSTVSRQTTSLWPFSPASTFLV